jgi:uncharacterized RDD family membrane protein YckC
MTNSTPAYFTAYAGFWKRFVAYFVDGVIVNLCSFLISLAMGVSNALAAENINWDTNLIIAYAIIICGSMLYFTLFESSPLQATPGKLMMGVKVTDLNGNRISFPRALGRYIGKIISGVLLGIGYLMIAFTEKKQGLHDFIAGTLVVEK